MAILKRNRTVEKDQLMPGSGCESQRGKNGLNRTAPRDEFPKINVFEENKCWVFTIEVPGVAPEDMELTLGQSLVTVKGKRASFFENESSRIYRRETCIGECEFARSFYLPEDGDRDRIDAHIKNGMLFITVEKTDENKRRAIEIKH